MRKVSAFIAILAIAFAGFATPAQATTWDDFKDKPAVALGIRAAQAATPKHNIKPFTSSQQGKAWAELDAVFEKRPAVKRAWLAQGDMLTQVGRSKTATSTYPMRSIAAKGDGFNVFTVSKAVKNPTITSKQFKDLKKVLPKCWGETRVNCYSEFNRRGTDKVNRFVVFPHITYKVK